MTFIQQHTLEEVFSLEQTSNQEKITFYKAILRRMFMDNLGPTDMEFQNVQLLVSIYEETLNKLIEFNGPNINNDNNKRW
jgi:hypothetical protein